jgi:hypothetical protein
VGHVCCGSRRAGDCGSSLRGDPDAGVIMPTHDVPDAGTGLIAPHLREREKQRLASRRRYAERQIATGNMSNVGAMVRSCAAKKGPLATADERERDAAWGFTASALAGEFRTRGRLGVLYTPEFVSGDGSRSQWRWLSIEELEIAAIEGGPERWWPPLAFLHRCWVDRGLAEIWKAARSAAPELLGAPRSERTGMPGRPALSKQLIDTEFERRKTEAVVERMLADEAKALLDWLRKQHPTAARPKQKTIENNLRDVHRGYWAEREPLKK